jgi:citrate synthase
MMLRQDLLTADEATAYLNVKPATLYTYVSRGWVRSVPSRDGRSRRYVRADLERLKARRDVRTGRMAIAEVPSVSAILMASRAVIDLNGPRYGERAALRLIEDGVPFESVAELLWTGVQPEAAPDWSAIPTPEWRRRELLRAIRLTSRTLDGTAHYTVPLVAAHLGVSVLASMRHGGGARTQRRGARIGEARTLLLWMAALAAVCVGPGPGRLEKALAARTVASRLEAAWGPDDRGGSFEGRVELLNRALVLCAHSDLDTPALVARATAAAGGDLCGCVAAGLDALSGSKHGGACDHLEKVIYALEDPWRAQRLLGQWLDRGREIPGFSHSSYRSDDPGVAPLLAAARATAPASRRVEALTALIDAMDDRGRGAPTLEVGIVGVSASLGLPPGAAAFLLSLGRTAGLIAHVIEEWTQGRRETHAATSNVGGPASPDAPGTTPAGPPDRASAPEREIGTARGPCHVTAQAPSGAAPPVR